MTYVGKLRIALAALISLILAVGSVVPSSAYAAGVIGILTHKKTVLSVDNSARTPNLQNMWLPKAAMNFDPSPAIGGGDVTIVDDGALLPAQGPSGTSSDIAHSKNTKIIVYVVRSGDTISGIADLLDITPNTIRWANDIPKGGALKVGQQLIILPVPGVKYTTTKGDTLESIAKRFGADQGDIASFNGLDGDLAIGTNLIIPNGEVAATVAPAPSVSGRTVGGGAKKQTRISRRIGSEPAHDVGPEGSASEVAYYISPLSRYIETQGIHGYNAVDLADPVGTPIVASASGDIIVAREGGWNGGYGSYVVIQHENGSQTLYGHMSQVDVGVGDSVVRGQEIGAVGNSGKSTGSHLHFEIRNGIKNPF